MSDFIHRAIPGDSPTLVLLHGTGGDENQLVQLGQMIAPGKALLGVRGKVLENGAPRYFRRLREGVFDLEDLRFRTHELSDFLATREGPLVAVGYSNGANIAASMLLLRPEVLSGAVLFHAQVPLEPESPPALKGKSIFLSRGLRDPIVPPANSQQLAEMFRQNGADLTLKDVGAGHELTNDEVEAARTWFEGRASW